MACYKSTSLEGLNKVRSLQDFCRKLVRVDDDDDDNDGEEEEEEEPKESGHPIIDINGTNAVLCCVFVTFCLALPSFIHFVKCNNN